LQGHLTLTHIGVGLRLITCQALG